MQIINWNICWPFFNEYINNILPDTTIFPSDLFFWSFQKNDLGISPLHHSCYMFHPLHCPYYVLENEIEFFLSLISQGCQSRKFLKSKNGKKECYFIHNKADVQNGVYDNYGNSFLYQRNYILWQCNNTRVKVNKRDLF
jgi:hypothetical protein